MNVLKSKIGVKEGSSNLITTSTATKFTSTKKKAEDKDKKEKNEEPEEKTWPTFNFDGSNALKTKLVLNLRGCQYDLLRTVALEELNWKIVDQFQQVWEPKSHNPNLIVKEETIEPEKKSEHS
jgi:hypothetical protein